MEVIFIIVILVFSIVIHEVAHASMANSLGDHTAKYAGRITLNPLKHIDPMGSIIIPFLLVIMRAPFIFGWAKPVPINPYNFTDQKYGRLKVAIAGPLSNFSIALFFGIISRLLPISPAIRSGIGSGFLRVGQIAIELGFWGQIFYLFLFIIFINTLLAIFNLIPIPPLDGSHILFTFFPSIEEKIMIFRMKAGFLGMAILFISIFILFPYIFQIVFSIFSLISGI